MKRKISFPILSLILVMLFVGCSDNGRGGLTRSDPNEIGVLFNTYLVKNTDGTSDVISMNVTIVIPEKAYVDDPDEFKENIRKRLRERVTEIVSPATVDDVIDITDYENPSFAKNGNVTLRYDILISQTAIP
jgi:hypothetical protein